MVFEYKQNEDFAKMLPEEIMEYTVSQIIKEGVEIVRFLADSPERSLILGIVGNSAYYGYVNI